LENSEGRRDLQLVGELDGGGIAEKGIENIFIDLK